MFALWSWTKRRRRSFISGKSRTLTLTRIWGWRVGGIGKTSAPGAAASGTAERLVFFGGLGLAATSAAGCPSPRAWAIGRMKSTGVSPADGSLLVTMLGSNLGFAMSYVLR